MESTSDTVQTETAQLIKKAFLNAYRLYTGNLRLHDFPRVSGAYYILKPKIYERMSTRKKKVSYTEIVSEIPQSAPANQPEYIIIILSFSYARKLRPYRFMERLEYIVSRIRRMEKHMGDKHYFIYFFYRKATSGVHEELRRVYARVRHKGINMVIKAIPYTLQDTIVQDLRRYIEKRINGLLDPRKYRRSNGYIFSYPKRFLEYLLILDALLTQQYSLAEQIADILHNTSEYPVHKYIELYNTIRQAQSIRENKNYREIRTSKPLYTPYI